MNINKYLIPVFDGPEPNSSAATGNPPPPAPPVATPPVAAMPAPAPEPTPAPTPAAPPVTPGLTAPNPDSPRWMLDRISAEATARQAAERRASDMEQMLQRLQGQNPTAPAPAPVTPPAAPAAQNPPFAQPPASQAPTSPAPNTHQAEIQREAARMRLYEDSAEVLSKGMSEYGDAFVTTQRILSAMGATTDDFVADVIAAAGKDQAHSLFKKIAEKPDKGMNLVNMTPRQRMAELVKMSINPAAPAAAATPPPVAPTTPAAPAPTTPSNVSPLNPNRGVSRAPAPAPALEPSTSNTVDWRSDDATDSQFDQGFWEMIERRSKGRRA